MRSWKNVAAILLLFLVDVRPASGENWTYERILTFAKSNVPEVMQAQAKVDLTRAKLAQAEASLWPHLIVESDYSRTDTPAAVFGSILNQRRYSSTLNFNDVPDTDNLALRGYAEYSLFTGGRENAERRAADAELNASRFDQASAERAYTTAAAMAFIEAWKANELIQAFNAAIETLQANEKAALKMVQSGSALETDALDVGVQLSSAREDLLSAENALKISKLALKSLLAVDDDQFELDLPSLNANPIAPGILPSRSEIEAVEARLAKGESLIDAAKSGYLPSLKARLGYQYDRGWETDGDNGSYVAGVLAQWNLWDGFATSAAVEQAKSAQTGLEYSRTRLKNQIALDIESNKLNLAEAESRLQISGKAQESAEKSAQITRLRYQQGLVTTTQLLDAEKALTTARVHKALALADSYFANVRLRDAYGRLPLNSLEDVHE